MSTEKELLKCLVENRREDFYEIFNRRGEMPLLDPRFCGTLGHRALEWNDLHLLFFLEDNVKKNCPENSKQFLERIYNAAIYSPTLFQSAFFQKKPSFVKFFLERCSSWSKMQSWDYRVAIFDYSGYLDLIELILPKDPGLIAFLSWTKARNNSPLAELLEYCTLDEGRRIVYWFVRDPSLLKLITRDDHKLVVKLLTRYELSLVSHVGPLTLVKLVFSIIHQEMRSKIVR